MTAYRIRDPFFVYLEQPGKPTKVYGPGEEVDLTPEQFAAHEHKLEAVAPPAPKDKGTGKTEG
ncbi:hypothetical protein [Gloeobacter kilaueensis]|uniref:Uncharacterized protein n=1 Tax=Gloeobacter kilaueensis (strain ATCC BAA-2537 / CCAP 1431/1 / ULC 316 / JS1) TaxID=1183438 RepID=U5QHJ4_GLOK1|nr:hypothetical protein [Gloeobacter kilaueensis]AGY57140.1 hypothetical protein GKIL_0894 [Gloeobacter kilaueensis JS1]